MTKRISVKGSIIYNGDKWIYDLFDMESTSPNDIENALNKANGEDVEVYINSGGGYVYVGSEIYSLLKDYKARVDVKIVGMAGSAASVIAMGANNGGKVMISPTAQIMIHNAQGEAEGDYRAMQLSADILQSVDKSIANAYILKTGMKQEDLLALMSKTTYLTAQEAKKYNFADEIMFDEGGKLTNSANGSFLIPPQVLNKVRNMVKPPGAPPKEPENGDNEPKQEEKQVTDGKKDEKARLALELDLI